MVQRAYLQRRNTQLQKWEDARMGGGVDGGSLQTVWWEDYVLYPVSKWEEDAGDAEGSAGLHTIIYLLWFAEV